MRKLICLAGAAIAIFLLPQVTLAAGLIIGPLCLDGVQGLKKDAESTIGDGGTWTPIDYHIVSESARIAIFPQDISETETLETCAQTEARMVAAGIQPIFSGRQTALQLRAFVYEGTQNNRVQINKEDFSATVVFADAGEHPVAGGRLSYKGSKLWIKSSKTILSKNDGIHGAILVTSWNRTIVGAHINLPGGLEYVADIRPRDEGNMTVEMDLNTGAAVVLDGDLVGIPKQEKVANARLDVLELNEASLPAASVRVVANHGVAEVWLGKVNGKAASARLPGKKINWTLDSTQVASDAIEAAVTQAKEGFIVGPATLHSLSLKSDSVRASNTAGQAFATGKGNINAQVLSAQDFDLRGDWLAPLNTALAPIFSNGRVTNLRLSLSGSQHNPSASIQLASLAMSIGALDLVRPTTLTTGTKPINVEISVPLDLEIPATGGSVELHDGAREIVLRGDLAALRLHGRIVIPLDDLLNSRLEIPQGQFNLEIGAAVSVSPFLAGTRPNFGSARIGVVNASDVVVASKSTGRLLLTTDILALGQPVFKVGDEGTSSPASLTLNSEGGAKLIYSLDSSKVLLGQAKFHATDIQFSLTGPAPHVLDFNGDLIREPRVEIKELQLEIDKLGSISIERGKISVLKIAADSIERRRRAGQPKGPAYSGKIIQPFEVETIVAGQVKIEDSVLFGGLDIKKPRFALEKGDFEPGDGSRFSNASIAIAVDRITQIGVAEEKQAFYTNAALAVSGRMHVDSGDFAVNNGIDAALRLRVSGPERAMSGVGNLDIGAFTGNARSSMEIDFKCNDVPKLKVPIEFNFGMTGSSFVATMHEGQLSAEGSVGPLGFDVHSVGSTGCNSPSDKKVIAAAQHGWTDGICTQLVPPKAWACKWEWDTPEVSFTYHIRLDVAALNAPVAMTNPRFYYQNSKVAVCNLGAVSVGVPFVFVGGYSPQIETNFGGDAEKIVNAIIAATFHPAQSLFATSLLTGAGWLVSEALTGSGNLLCIGRI